METACATVLVSTVTARAERTRNRWFADEYPMKTTEPHIAPINLAASADFSVGVLRVRPSIRSIETDVETVTLEPRVMQVLMLLAEHPGQTVTRDDMITRCWGGIVVGEDAIQRCIGRLRRTAETIGGFEIETLSRIGYRLSILEAKTDNRLPQVRSVGDQVERPSIAFAGIQTHSPLSQDTEFAELLADDVTDALSLNRDIQVAARVSTIGAEVDIRTIGQALDVDFVATAVFRRTGEAARLRLQLAKAESRRIVWTYSVENLLLESAVPSDDLVVDLASRIATELAREETNRALSKRDGLTAWEAVVRANAAYQRINLDSLAFAIKEARRAVALDPGFGAAHAALANALAATYELGGGQDPATAAEARTHCDLALATDQDNPTVLTWVSNALGMITRPAEGLAYGERAIELAPTHPIAHLYISRQYLHHGRADDAIAALEEHDRVAPRFPWQYYVTFFHGLAQFMTGQIDDAERSFDRSSQMNPDYPYSWIAKTIVYSVLGRLDDARKSADRLKALDGEDTLALQLARVAHSYPDPGVAAPLQEALRNAWQASESAVTSGIKAARRAIVDDGKSQSPIRTSNKIGPQVRAPERRTTQEQATSESVQTETRFFTDRDDRRIAYSVSGNGPTVICPAWWVSSVAEDLENSVYRDFFRRLGRGVTLVRYDRPGTGLSDRTYGKHSLEGETALMEDLVKELNADRFSLFAMSAGGPTAIAYAARHPNQVDRICFYGSYVNGAELSPPDVQSAFLATIRAHWGLGSRAIADLFLPDADRETLLEFARQQRSAAEAGAAADLLELTYRVDVRSLLSSVRVSSLVMHRRGDKCIPVEQARQLAAGIAGAKLKIFGGTAHLPWIDGEKLASVANAFVSG